MPSARATAMGQAMRWDIFCRVIDNHGDLGVCWRLATQLAAEGDCVRLVVDDASALAWMAPERALAAPRVAVHAWPGPADPADVVIEAFGCDPPEAYVDALRARASGGSATRGTEPPANPVWINLEYLSAESYVERSHGLASPRADGLRKWFFYPGFTPFTGGLLREPGLMQRRATFDRDAWLRARGLARRPEERVAVLFCYGNPMIGPWLGSLAQAPTLLLLTPGHAQRQVEGARPGVRVARMPWLDQVDFDHLLWSADLNAVRGEDSLVRAIWAGAPFLWQAYPQDDGAHAAKLEALLATLDLPPEAGAASRAWNGLAPWPGLPSLGTWRAATEAARERLLRQDNLATQLRRFVRLHS